jgi:hypothetical protein
VCTSRVRLTDGSGAWWVGGWDRRRSLERLDVASPFPESGPPAEPHGASPQVRHDLAGAALALALADDPLPGNGRERPRPRGPPPLPAAALPAQLPGAGDAPHGPREAAPAHAQQAVDPAAQGAGQHQLPQAELVADARPIGGAGGAGRGTGGAARRLRPGLASWALGQRARVPRPLGGCRVRGDWPAHL